MFEINTNKGFECMIPAAPEEEEVTVKSNDRHIKLNLFGYELKLTLTITRS